MSLMITGGAAVAHDQNVNIACSILTFCTGSATGPQKGRPDLEVRSARSLSGRRPPGPVLRWLPVGPGGTLAVLRAQGRSRVIGAGGTARSRSTTVWQNENRITCSGPPCSNGTMVRKGAKTAEERAAEIQSSTLRARTGFGAGAVSYTHLTLPTTPYV